VSPEALAVASWNRAGQAAGVLDVDRAGVDVAGLQAGGVEERGPWRVADRQRSGGEDVAGLAADAVKFAPEPTVMPTAASTTASAVGRH
jgi:hypothetical protein